MASSSCVLTACAHGAESPDAPQAESTSASTDDVSPDDADDETPPPPTATCAAGPLELGRTYTGCSSGPTPTTFSFTAPPDVAGGWVRISAKNVVGNALSLRVLSVEDQSTLVSTHRIEDDAPVSGWLAVKPGAEYELQIGLHYRSESGATYDLQLDYTKFDDPYEPNDSREEAHSIAKNETIHAVAVGGIAGKTTVEPEHYDDWFSVDLTAGEVEVKVTNPDPRAMMGVRLFDATDKQIGGESGTRGADLVLRETIGTAGRYFVRVRLVGRSFIDILSGGVNDEVPKSFTPYGLRIEQRW